jgi:hypothetical protein
VPAAGTTLSAWRIPWVEWIATAICGARKAPLRKLAGCEGWELVPVGPSDVEERSHSIMDEGS